MKKAFKVGDKVVLASDIDDYDYEGSTLVVGTVQQIKEEKVLVKWAKSSWRNPNVQELHVDELLSKEAATLKYSELEAEYNAWTDPIKEKMEQAGKLLGEAGKLAKAKNRELAEMHDLVYPLIKEMDNLGWSTSSLNC